MENYEQLKEKGITPYWCIQHGVTVSMYYADPDGNQLEFQVDCFESNEDSDAFIHGPNFNSNPIGIEFEPEDWLSHVRAGTPASDFLVRKTDEPVSPLRGVLAKISIEALADRVW